MTKEYINEVYNFLFYTNGEWKHEGSTQYYWGTLIHYRDFMKAKRGTL